MNILDFIRRGILIATIAFSTSMAWAQDAAKVATADNSFAFDLFRKIASAQPEKNIFISPLSVSSVLLMIANGAAGDTRTELAGALHIGQIAPPGVNAACKALDASLDSETNAVLTIANGIWCQQDCRLKPGFIDDNKNFFGAELASVDFKIPASAEAINAWADRQTHGRIQDVVQYPFPSMTRLVLANAIYFKGRWAEPFDRGRTEKGSFRPAGGAVKNVMMMSQQKEFDYVENERFQAVRLPYAGNRLGMYLFLPATNSDAARVAADLTGDGWQSTVSGFRERKGLVEVPRFKLDYDVVLNESLQALGMKQAFDPNKANFSAMADEPLFIGLVKQKSYVAVDEEGTEAAAVTVGLMRTTAIRMNEPPPFRMIVDRPFFFVIADRQTQAILFMGIVNDPVN